MIGKSISHYRIIDKLGQGWAGDIAGLRLQGGQGGGLTPLSDAATKIPRCGSHSLALGATKTGPYL
jgi:hypothetical protein